MMALFSLATWGVAIPYNWKGNVMCHDPNWIDLCIISPLSGAVKIWLSSIG